MTYKEAKQMFEPLGFNVCENGRISLSHLGGVICHRYEDYTPKGMFKVFVESLLKSGNLQGLAHERRTQLKQVWKTLKNSRLQLSLLRGFVKYIRMKRLRWILTYSGPGLKARTQICRRRICLSI